VNTYRPSRVSIRDVLSLPLEQTQHPSKTKTENKIAALATIF
jgi:hypothetical protein